MNVNLSQAANLVRNIGSSNTILLRGQPGIGKSSILNTLARELPDYQMCYIDVANLDLGDLGMPVIDKDTMVTNYAPNSLRCGPWPDTPCRADARRAGQSQPTCAQHAAAGDSRRPHR